MESPEMWYSLKLLVVGSNKLLVDSGISNRMERRSRYNPLSVRRHRIALREVLGNCAVVTKLESKQLLTTIAEARAFERKQKLDGTETGLTCVAERRSNIDFVRGLCVLPLHKTFDRSNLLNSRLSRKVHIRSRSLAPKDEQPRAMTCGATC